MTKILMGLMAAIIVAVGGFFGFQFYTQHRVASEINAAFEQIRTAGGKASHGKISFDLRSGTLEIADIAVESPTQPPLSVKIASLKAAGFRQPDATHVVADTIEATDVDVDATVAGPTVLRVRYELPQVALKDYSGPASLSPRPAPGASAIDFYRYVVEQFARIAIASVKVPSLAVAIDGGAPISAGYIYSNLALHDIRDGRIASIKGDRVAVTANMQPAGLQRPGKGQKFTGEMENLVVYDFDAMAAATIIDASKANDDHYYRVYRQMSAGSYTVNLDQGSHMRIDGITIDDVAVRPSRVQLATLMSIIQPSQEAATLPPAQARALMANVASIYEGIRVGNAEVHGMSMETPQGSGKLASIRMNLENGKFGELAIEGLDAPTPKGPVRLERFALKSLDISGLMRMSAQFAGQKPSPDLALGLLPLIEGVEINGLVAPYKNTGKFFNGDTISLNWGHFVGPIPSTAHLIVKMCSPLDPTDPRQGMLLASGWDRAAIIDLGAGWAKSSATFALEPVALEIGGFLKASARVSLTNVPEGVFSTNPAQAMAAAAQLEAGTLELTLHDTGGVDLAVEQYARLQNVNREAARSAMSDGFRAIGEKAAEANPDAAAAVDALARFVEVPGQTLTIKLSPLGKVPALQLMQLLRTDPLIALAQFKIEASTGL